MARGRYAKLLDEDCEHVEIRRLPVEHSLLPYRAVIAVLLALNVFLAALCWHFASSQQPQLVYSPSASAVHYEKRRLHRDIEHNVYTGEPRPEHDAAWARIIEPITIKVSRDELAKINESSIAFEDGSGYIAETAVYHELHCIKRIRRHLYLDYYYPNMTAEEQRLEGPHIDHCLEYLREAAICRGDTTLSTFRWAENGKPYSRVYSDHQCVVWEELDAWARGRMVDMSDYSMLKHPGS